MSPKKELNSPIQLLVEGSDAFHFFHAFNESIGVSNIQIHDFGGIGDLANYLSVLVKSPEFRSLPVESIGIIRDAEKEDSDSAFRSICSALQKNQLPVPFAPITPVVEGRLKVNTFILPDLDNPGMLETLILRAVSSDPAFDCIQVFLDCVMDVREDTPSPIDKARFLTYLASRPSIKPLTGHAARAGFLNFDSDEYDPLKSFLQGL